MTATARQIGKIHALKKSARLDDDSYRDVLDQVAGVRSAKGLTVQSAIRVIDRLQKAPEVGSVSLEDADWETLKARVEAAKFQVVASEIVEMVENVTNAKSVTE